MTSLKTSIKTITYLSDIGCLEIQGASLGAMVFISFEGDIVNGDAVEVEVERGSFNPCANPADAWPIITENNISIILDNPAMPCATDNARDLFDDAGPNVGVAYDNPLRAAMIVFLMMQDANNA